MDSVEDIDARLDELTNAIHEAMSASAAKSQPAKQLLLSILPMILANILEKNRLRRQWQFDRDPSIKNRVRCLQRWIAFELKKMRNAQWTDKIESLNPDDQSIWKMTKRVMRIPDPNPPLQVPGDLEYTPTTRKLNAWQTA